MKKLSLILSLALLAAPLFAQQRVNTELPDAVTLADNTASPAAPAAGAFLMCYDTVGANWDRCGISTDWTVSSAIGTSGPGTILEAKDYDGAAFPQMSSPAEGDAVPGAASLYGVSYMMPVSETGATSPDPCFFGSSKLYLPIDIVTATTTEITPSLPGASTHYYVCSVSLFVAAANNVALVEDDSDGCGSTSAGVMGGNAAGEGWVFGLTTGTAFNVGSGMGAIARTTTANRVLCLITSTTAQVSGSITVVAAP